MTKVDEANVTLQGLLSRIKERLSADERSELSDALVLFAEELPAEPEFAELTQSALDASDTLDRAITKSAMKGLRSRTAALKRYVSAINSVTNKAKQAAAEARLETIQKVLIATKNVTGSALEAKQAFEENRNDAGFKALEKVIEEINKLDD